MESHKTWQLVYEKFGDPDKVLFEFEVNVPPQLARDELRVRWLAASINPSDLSQIRGVYPINKKFPIVGGNEGVGIVEEVGESVRGIQVGAHVIPCARQLGTWQTRTIVSTTDVIVIDKQLAVDIGAQLVINPPTAYRMLHDFVKLQPGDVVIQNGANSAVGRYVIQMARLCGWRTVNIIRQRDDAEQQRALINELKTLGADLVVTDVEFTAKSAQVMQPLANEEAFVESMEFHPFFPEHVWSGSLGKVPMQERQRTMNWITEQFVKGKLVGPLTDRVEYKNWKQAVAVAITGTGNKQLLIFDE